MNNSTNNYKYYAEHIVRDGLEKIQLTKQNDKIVVMVNIHREKKHSNTGGRRKPVKTLK